MMGPSEPPKSFHCSECEICWPPSQHFSACPKCDKPTQTSKLYDCEFETEAIALAHAAQIKEAQRKHTEFERYYLEVHIPAGARLVEDAIKKAAKQTPAELAAEFAMLCIPRPKEESHE